MTIEEQLAFLVKKFFTRFFVDYESKPLDWIEFEAKFGEWEYGNGEPVKKDMKKIFEIIERIESQDINERLTARR
jgi:hypothetical protein